MNLPFLSFLALPFVVASKNPTFLWLSDLHLDPFYGSPSAGEGAACGLASVRPLGQMGCDAPTALVEESIQYAVNLTSSNPPTFILLTGDLVRHGTDQLQNPVETTRSILLNVSHLVATSFPSTSIIPTVGNNDVTPDYFLDVADPSDMLDMLAQGLDPLFASSEERASFRVGGYLARDLSSTLTILSLNTVMYATSHFPETKEADPLGQFSWLHAQLTRAETSRRQVYLVGHIPPVVGSYRHSQLWQDEYLDKYYELIEEFRSVISAQCFGHLHADEFRFIYHKDSQPWPILLASSVTPVYGSHPSIRQVTYDTATNALLDYDTWFIDLEYSSTWQQELSFLESFPMAVDLTAESLSKIVAALNATMQDEDAPIWKVIKKRQHVSLDEPDCTDIDCRKAWLCTLVSTTAAVYADCLHESGVSPIQVWKARLSPRVRWMSMTIVIVAAIFVCICCLTSHGPRYLRRRHYQKHLSQDGDVVMGTNDPQIAASVGGEAFEDEEEVPMELPRIA